MSTVPHYLILYYPPRPTFGEDATESESRIIAHHFDYLQEQYRKGILRVAGRPEDARFGIAVITATSREEARRLMENDPAVRQGIFTAELLDFRPALGF